ncbi:hypothetical protein [Pseudoxanthomonas indica]|uniref:Uncharacterized protein n=1 Tax=Pseudoxanthomonas indica TaxID=428993 RepID=A0A1T5KD43_9GAMM|nr:hypothetical protein [Pseudoxanthomonas indica]GGD48530.1 hypothetical protein GCM10007235_20570 [Pseudoxanthomonas indica]SKC61611.1 hypothetical protein SAMN06296058_1595 [Pseudoxanthomonas indica]
MTLLVVQSNASRIDVAIDTQGKASDGTWPEFSKLVHFAAPNMLIAARGDRQLLAWLHDYFFSASVTVRFDDARDSIPHACALICDRCESAGHYAELQFLLAGHSQREREMIAIMFNLETRTRTLDDDRLWDDRRFWYAPWEASMGRCPAWVDDPSVMAIARRQAAHLKGLGEAGGGRLLVATLSATSYQVRDLGPIVA